MYASLVKPDTLSPSELDIYLEKGWFRQGSSLFTTSFLTFQNSLFDALWIRIHVPPFEPSRSQREILKKTSAFVVRVGKFVLTEEKEALFWKYRAGVSFQAAHSLESILPPDTHLFDSREICMYDGARLVACGVFDRGATSAEGIVNFFDPEYKRLSLGKALMLHKLKACKEDGIQWFYPGYVVPGYGRFDYKVEISPLHSQYYDLTEDLWKSTASLELKKQPLGRMTGALVQLEGILHSFGFEVFRLKRYRFYDIALNPVYGEEGLMTYPLFIHCFTYSGWEEVVIVYDTFGETYKLVVCRKMFTATFPAEEHYYSDFLLREERVVFSESNPFNFVFGLNKLLRRSSSEVKN